MPRLIVHDRAEADLDQIADYIAADSIDAALRFLQAARQAFQMLSEFPGAGAPHPTDNPMFANLRIWPITGFRNFLVCYLRVPEGAQVLRVIHGARDVDRVFK
jgi:toxin ParE1/3/4